jgi:general secretion pathway protein G
MKQTIFSTKRKQGFTLVEILVVVAIIGILMGLVTGISGAVQQGAAEAKAKAEIADLMNEIEKYKVDKGSYPDNWSDFGSWYTNEKYSGTAYTITEGEPDAPIDPWGSEYLYDFDSDRPFVYFIGSSGPNGTDDNGDVDDITNRNGALN